MRSHQSNAPHAGASLGVGLGALTVMSAGAAIYCWRFVLLAALVKPLDVGASAIEMKELDAHQFSLGWVGFAAHISAAERQMNLIVTKEDAESTFESIIDSPKLQLVAKLYALCGLKRIKSTAFARNLSKVESMGGKVSTLQGDVMRMEDVQVVVKDISINRCN